jgi:hypothetical protein
MNAIPSGTLNTEPLSKLGRERQSFYRLLTELLTTHCNQYVAIHDQRVVESGPERLALAMRVLQQVGNVDISVGLVSDQPRAIARSGVRRDLSQERPAS